MTKGLRGRTSVWVTDVVSATRVAVRRNGERATRVIDVPSSLPGVVVDRCVDQTSQSLEPKFLRGSWPASPILHSQRSSPRTLVPKRRLGANLFSNRNSGRQSRTLLSSVPGLDVILI